MNKQKIELRKQAVKKWKEHYQKKTGYAPDDFTITTFKTGFNTGWNVHRKKEECDGVDYDKEKKGG